MRKNEMSSSSAKSSRDDEERERLDISASSSGKESRAINQRLKHAIDVKTRLEDNLYKATEAITRLVEQRTDAISNGNITKERLVKDLYDIAVQQRKRVQTRLDEATEGLARLRRGSDIAPPAKKLALIKVTTIDKEKSLEDFLSRQTLKFRDGIPTGFFDLDESLWAHEDEVNFVYNREWYAKTAPLLVENFRKQVRRTYIVAGNQGTGKSVFGFVLLLYALKDGLIVAYQNASLRLWIVGERSIVKDPESFRMSFHRRGYEPALEPGVYECDEVILFERLAKKEGVMYIVDVEDSFLGEITPTIPKVVISSPNHDKLRRIGEIARPAYVYMPLWSYEEIQALNERLPPATSDLKYVKQEEKELRSLYTIFGGVPRILFENTTTHDKIEDLDNLSRRQRLKFGSTSLQRQITPCFNEKCRRCWCISRNSRVNRDVV